jgi:hypothetical protein
MHDCMSACGFVLHIPVNKQLALILLSIIHPCICQVPRSPCLGTQTPSRKFRGYTQVHRNPTQRVVAQLHKDSPHPLQTCVIYTT